MEQRPRRRRKRSERPRENMSALQHVRDTLTTRLGDRSVGFGEFCVYKWIGSTYRGQITAQKITKTCHQPLHAYLPHPPPRPPARPLFFPSPNVPLFPLVGKKPLYVSSPARNYCSSGKAGNAQDLQYIRKCEESP